MALAPLPGDRFRFDVRRARFAEDEGPLVDGCPCTTCATHTRAYVHYLSRSEELTGVRLLAVHNLSYLERLVRGSREAIGSGRFGDYRAAILNGASPWTPLTSYERR
jgi:queuine tRNA-ribosyltransferase